MVLVFGWYLWYRVLLIFLVWIKFELLANASIFDVSFVYNSCGTNWNVCSPLNASGYPGYPGSAVDLAIFSSHCSGVGSILGVLFLWLLFQICGLAFISLEHLFLFVWIVFVIVFFWFWLCPFRLGLCCWWIVICFGFLVILRFTFWFCLLLVFLVRVVCIYRLTIRKFLVL